jgi:Uma2 family endonuclease
MITDINQLDFSKQYTYSDYLTWQFSERVELLKGRVFRMSPAPNRRHQSISTVVLGRLFNFLTIHPCQVFAAPFDVRLPLPPDQLKGDKVNTVVQPDITVVCDEGKLDVQGCNGAPDIVMEILSSGNTPKEMKRKLVVYQEAGIPEYWVIDPDQDFVIIYNLDKAGRYVGSIPFTDEDKAVSNVLEGFSLDLSEVFKR